MQMDLTPLDPKWMDLTPLDPKRRDPMQMDLTPLDPKRMDLTPLDPKRRDLIPLGPKPQLLQYHNLSIAIRFNNTILLLTITYRTIIFFARHKMILAFL